MTGNLLKIYPYFDKNNAQPIWYSLTDDLPVSMPHEQWAFIRYSMNLIAEKVAHQAYNEVRILLDKTKKYQQKEARGFLPSDTRFGAEMLYNRMNFTRPLAMFSLTIGILSFFLYCWKMAKQRNSSKKTEQHTACNARYCFHLSYDTYRAERIHKRTPPYVKWLRNDATHVRMCHTADLLTLSKV